jgi:hypothetical protein
LNKTIPLYGPGFLTDGTLEAQGASAQGLLTTLHYADGLDLPKDKAFRADYNKAYKMAPDVYAVQGYDAAQMLNAGLTAVKGDVAKRDDLVAAMEKARIDSPRGAFTLSKSHDPVQDIYLRKVVGTENRYEGVAVKALADPSPGCKMYVRRRKVSVASLPRYFAPMTSAPPLSGRPFEGGVTASPGPHPLAASRLAPSPPPGGGFCWLTERARRIIAPAQ